MSKLTTLISLILLLTVFAGVNIVATRALSSARLDLTDGRVYTLSEAGQRIARSPAEPVSLTLYMSRALMAEQPRLKEIGGFIEEKLGQFLAAGAGKVTLTVIDPEPSSEAEDAAIGEGMRGLPTPEGNLYVGLVARNALDGREVVPLFNVGDPQFERFLEFEIAKIIERLGTGEKPRVGLVTSLPMEGSGPDQFSGAPGSAPWRLFEELSVSFEVVGVPAGSAALPEGLSALLVVHPKGLGEPLQYAIDQYLMRGGKAVVLVDPLCEIDQSGVDPRNPMSVYQSDRTSEALATLTAWGVSVDREDVVLDLGLGMVLPGGQGGAPQRYLQYLRLDQSPGAWVIAPDDPATRGLGDVIYWLGGEIEVSAEAKVQAEPLLRSSAESSRVLSTRVSWPGTDQSALLAAFVPGERAMTFAARLRGEGAPSAFPDGPPAGAAAPAEGHLAASAGPVNVAVIADADIASDRLWLSPVNIGGMTLGYERISDNGAFVLNLVDQFAGSGDLVALRARGPLTRPLTRIEEMNRAADSAIAAQTEAVNGRIEEAERKINDIQQGRSDAGDATALFLTPEQEAALEDAQRAIAEARTERRRIEYDLRRDVEGLKTRVQVINTAMVPGLLCTLAIGLAGYRAVQRRADRRKGEGR